MRLKTKHIVDVLIGLFLLYSLIQVRESQEARRAEVSTSAVTTTTVVSPETSVPSAGSPEGGGNRADITQQVRGFLDAYYLLTPEDTEQSRLQRIRPYIPGSVPPGVSIGLSEGSELDQYRRSAKLTVKGQVKDDKINVEPAAIPQGDTTDDVIVSATVLVTVTDAEERIVNQGEQATVSRWANRSGSWVVVKFQAGGDME
jgi:hypothetical protein